MIDFLIVGGGLAGCNLAYNLINEGKSVMMIDEPNAYSSSKIAAGIFNPLLPRHHKISYNADLIYPGLNQYYQKFETWLGEQIFFNHPVHYILTSSAEQNDWSALAYSSHLGHWVDVNTNKLNRNLKAPFGYLKIKHSGWVDTGKLTDLCKTKLFALGALRNETFDFNFLQMNLSEINYKDIKAGAIIFCEGLQIENNLLIKNIALKPAKGEMLIIKTDMEIDYIAQQGVFMLPLGNNIYKVGSNFTWNALDNLPTQEGKEEILSKLSLFYKGEYEIVEHYAGIRPSSTDRRPILGAIQPHKNCFVFNGLGSKGVALSAYYSQVLINNIMKGETIDKEVSANRKLMA